MADLATQQIAQAGLGPAYAAADGDGDTVEAGDRIFLHVKNGGGGAITVTLENVTPSNYGQDVDLAVSVPAAGERMIGPVSPQRFGATNGRANITYSGVGTVTVGAFRV